MSLGKPEKYLTGLAGLFPAYSENKPVKNGDYGFKPYIKRKEVTALSHIKWHFKPSKYFFQFYDVMSINCLS